MISLWTTRPGPPLILEIDAIKSKFLVWRLMSVRSRGSFGCQCTLTWCIRVVEGIASWMDGVSLIVGFLSWSGTSSLFVE